MGKKNPETSCVSLRDKSVGTKTLGAGRCRFSLGADSIQSWKQIKILKTHQFLPSSCSNHQNLFSCFHWMWDKINSIHSNLIWTFPSWKSYPWTKRETLQPHPPSHSNSHLPPRTLTSVIITRIMNHIIFKIKQRTWIMDSSIFSME